MQSFQTLKCLCVAAYCKNICKRRTHTATCCSIRPPTLLLLDWLRNGEKIHTQIVLQLNTKWRIFVTRVNQYISLVVHVFTTGASIITKLFGSSSPHKLHSFALIIWNTGKCHKNNEQSIYISALVAQGISKPSVMMTSTS